MCESVWKFFPRVKYVYKHPVCGCFCYIFKGYLVAEEGLEPPTRGLWFRCSICNYMIINSIYIMCETMCETSAFQINKFSCLLSTCYKFIDRRFLNNLIINSSAHIRSYTWISKRTGLSESAQTITFWDCWKVHPKCIMHRSLKSFGRLSQEPMECQWYIMKRLRFLIVKKSRFHLL